MRGSSAKRLSRFAALVVGAALLVGCSGSSGASPSAAAKYPLHMRITPSNAAYVVAKDQGYFERIDFSYDLVGYGESAQLFLAGTDPVGQESAWEAARFQSEGEDISYFGTPSTLNMINGVIIRAADADKYKTLADLKGKKLGQPGFGTGTWQAFEIIAKANYGLAAKTDFQPVEADPGALLGLLQKGDIDATINFAAQMATGLTNPDFKVIMNFSEDWAGKHGQPLVINGLMAHRTWLDANTEVARDLVQGVNRGLTWMKDNPDAFRKGGKYANIVEGEGWYGTDPTTEKILELLKKDQWYLSSSLYNQAWVDSVYEFIQQGQGVFADTIPAKDKIFYLPLLQK
jgi:ABC-type nitrate/sulfonate/bicarbonate transport system substrate-binding protein